MTGGRESSVQNKQYICGLLVSVIFNIWTGKYTSGVPRQPELETFSSNQLSAIICGRSFNTDTVQALSTGEEPGTAAKTGDECKLCNASAYLCRYSPNTLMYGGRGAGGNPGNNEPHLAGHCRKSWTQLL